MDTRDLARTTLGVGFIAAMIVATLWVLSPFLAAAIWATTIVVATWPIMLAVQARLGGRRTLAMLVMTVVFLLGLIVPIAGAIIVILTHADEVIGWATALPSLTFPTAPGWLERVPVVGPRLLTKWQEIAASPGEFSATLVPYARIVGVWLVGMAGSVAKLLVQFLLIVAIAAFLYARGEGAAAFVRAFAHRLAGERGERSVGLAGRAIRGVALGVIVTALVQAALAGLGLAVAGIPFAALLTAVIVLLALAQLGPFPVLVPAVIWLYWKGDPVWATVLLVWTLVVGSIDNVLRPLLIRKGANLPLPLIFIGVIGGLIGFGFIGIFIGPVVLAVTYTLLVDWVQSGEPSPGSRGAGA